MVLKIFMLNSKFAVHKSFSKQNGSTEYLNLDNIGSRVQKNIRNLLEEHELVSLL